MQAKNILEIKTGKGIVFPVGTEFTLSYDSNKQSTLVTCNSDKGRVLIYCKNMHKYFKGFKKAPGLKAIERMNDAASASTITGKTRVECDGVGPDGFPAWPLALGFL